MPYMIFYDMEREREREREREKSERMSIFRKTTSERPREQHYRICDKSIPK
jgi:hypothetical protein